MARRMGYAYTSDKYQMYLMCKNVKSLCSEGHISKLKMLNVIPT